MLLLLVLTAAYVLAVANGIVTIDVAATLFWAIEIADGRALPFARSAGGIGRAAGRVVVPTSVRSPYGWAAR